MSTTLVVGLDGSDGGKRAVAHATHLAKLIGQCKLVVCYVIEWSPYTFQTPEENEQRHIRREEELSLAHERILDPVIKQLTADGFDVEGVVRHGKASRILNELASEKNADQIIVARTSDGGLSERIFGSVTSNLVLEAKVPVTVVA